MSRGFKPYFLKTKEARKIGIPVVGDRRVIRVPSVWWRHETVMVRGKGQTRYRDVKSGRFIKKP
jgi:hypothetical protein